MDKNFTPRILASLMLALGLLSAVVAPASAKSEINSSFIGSVAIDGTDTVAYFTEGKAVKGLSDFTHRWKGGAWWFKNAANRDAFAASPEKYSPQFGGYCAWAVSRGYTASIDPEVWKIYRGKLYLNYSKGVQAQWVEEIPGNIAKAESYWPGVLDN